MKKKNIFAALAVIPLVALLAGCAGASDGAATGTDGDAIKIGVVGASDPYWAFYTEAAAAEGIEIELVDFAQYPQVNPALAAGEVDLNQFQHIAYLAEYNEASSDNLVPIGATAIYPIALYSSEYSDVDDIARGDTVAVPDDDSNQARALVLLQSEGLIELTDGGTIYSSIDDIDEAASKVKVTALEASLTASSLPDVAAAIINNDFAEKAGLKFEDAIATDDATDPNALPYANIFAARDEDKNNETLLKLVEIYQSTQAVQDGVFAVSGDTAVMLTTPVADLVESLAGIQAEIKAAK
ncbi:D-methionine transport system substrate-binding protein [Cryobacterium flavum]|uniref:D-methionine transport system substrate-binding protein n=1 Tax=Cryobacterium flavum TaxID=1424659 RepID=A0A4R8VH36_9MICO|nr:MetQ/NlpA family ABC transporter substrate-binding protein [Cryobacterium flavum]TFB81632.1 methionine ABC transporter substrate-binding protein [Cryobacterium flavum]SDN60175.1 D-methionine transport system substrate-binding protein [Cryobacterium flavum]